VLFQYFSVSVSKNEVFRNNEVGSKNFVFGNGTELNATSVPGFKLLSSLFVSV
jgi:hypothetical protein